MRDRPPPERGVFLETLYDTHNDENFTERDQERALKLRLLLSRMLLERIDEHGEEGKAFFPSASSSFLPGGLARSPPRRATQSHDPAGAATSGAAASGGRLPVAAPGRGREERDHAGGEAAPVLGRPGGPPECRNVVFPKEFVRFWVR